MDKQFADQETTKLIDEQKDILDRFNGAQRKLIDRALEIERVLVIIERENKNGIYDDKNLSTS